MTAAHPPTFKFAKVGALTLAFSPKGEAEAMVVQAINLAKVSVQVQAYEFSSAPIAEAVIAAHKRGLTVMVILDKANKANKVNVLSKWFNPVGKSSLLPALQAAGVPVLFDTAPTIAHSKIAIVDAAVVVTGSFNFSHAAQETNTENLLVIRDKAVAGAYGVNFTWRQGLSKP